MAEQGNIPAPDMRIITSGGQSIPAHSTILAWASPVLESMIDRPQKRTSSEGVISILGVPYDAVVAFIRFLYSSRSASKEDEEDLEKYGMHLLVLSHAYQVRWLKRACEAGLASRLTAEVVVDVLQLARQCDAPWLYMRCMKLLSKDFGDVEKTEAWLFLQYHDPSLELEILQFLQESDSRAKRRRRKREEQEVYLELSEAMECLRHICTEGCTEVGPRDTEPPGRNMRRCPSYRTCHGLQLLIRHFAVCSSRKTSPGGCRRCKLMWQLLRLHSSICDQLDCKVPLCKQFKGKEQQMERKAKVEDRWRILVNKVVSVRVMTNLAKRKRGQHIICSPSEMGVRIQGQ